MGGSFLASAKDFLANTHLVEQVSEVQVVELFTNPWFMVPFVALIQKGVARYNHHSHIHRCMGSFRNRIHENFSNR